MDLKTLKHVLKCVNNQFNNLCIGRRSCCSWEAPQIDGMIEENKLVAKYLEGAIKRTEKKLNKENHDEVPNRPGRRPQAKKRKIVPGRGR